MSFKQPRLPPPGLKHWLALAAACLGQFASLSAAQAGAVHSVDLRGTVGASFDEGAWIPTAYSVGELVMIPLVPMLSTAFTSRAFQCVAGVLFVCFSFAACHAHTVGGLLSLRVLWGMTGGALSAMAFKLTIANFNGDHRPVGITFFALCGTLPSVFATAILGQFDTDTSWEAGLLWLTVPPILVMLVCAWYGLAPSPQERVSVLPLKQGDWGSAIALSAGACCIAAVFDQGNRLDWFNSQLIVELLVLGLFLLASAFVLLNTARTPLFPTDLLKVPTFTFPLILNSAFRLGLLSYSLVATQFLVSLHGFRSAQLGPAFLIVGVPQLLVGPIAYWLATVFDERILLSIGLVMLATGSAMMTGATNLDEGPQIAFALLLQGISQPLVIVPLVIISTAQVKVYQSPTANTLFNMTRSLYTTMGSGLLVTLITKREQFHSVRLTEAVAYGVSSADSRLSALTAAGMSSQATVAKLADQVRAQAFTLSYSDAGFVIAVALLAAIFLVWMIPGPPPAEDLRTWARRCAELGQDHVGTAPRRSAP